MAPLRRSLRLRLSVNKGLVVSLQANLKVVWIQLSIGCLARSGQHRMTALALAEPSPSRAMQGLELLQQGLITVLPRGCETVTVTALPLHSQVIFEVVVSSHFRLPSVLVSSCHDAGTLLAEESSAICLSSL